MPTLILAPAHVFDVSLFSDAGKKFEKTKRALVGDEEEAYACAACEQPVAEDFEYCPHCGEDAVEPTE